MRTLGAIGLLISACLANGCSSLGTPTSFRQLEQNSFFQPAKYPLGNWNPPLLSFENARFISTDGVKLHGWFLAAEKPLGVALVCHGNAGNVTDLAETLEILVRRHQLSTLVFDYRGYGKSAGTPSESGLLLDARAARKWLAERNGIEESAVILLGFSLGGAVAIDLAAADGARGLVVSSAFTSAPDVAQHHVWWLPTRYMMSVQFDSLEKIAHYPGPLLVAHREQDEVVPFDHGRQLYEAAPGPKQLLKISSGSHNDPQPEEYRQALDQFLQGLPPVRRT